MGGLAKGERERRAVIYVRVSSARQAEDGLPIEIADQQSVSIASHEEQVF